MNLKESYINVIVRMLSDLSETNLKRVYEYTAHKWLRTESVIGHEE